MVYIGTFLYIVKRRKSIGKIEEYNNEEETSDKDTKDNVSIDCKQIKNSFEHVGTFMIILFCMYLNQYVIITCYADRAWRETSPETDSNWIHKNAYKVLFNIYQIGIFFGRASIELFKIPRVSLLSAIQVALFIMWTIIAIYPSWIEIQYQMVLMLLVGLVGGLVYVNCMYYVQECKALNKNQKEVTMSMNFMFKYCGTLLGSLIS